MTLTVAHRLLCARREFLHQATPWGSGRSICCGTGGCEPGLKCLQTVKGCEAGAGEGDRWAEVRDVGES